MNDFYKRRSQIRAKITRRPFGRKNGQNERAFLSHCHVERYVVFNKSVQRFRPNFCPFSPKSVATEYVVALQWDARCTPFSR